jgi:polyhydroxyalkanoate synthesis regulator phasin
MSESLQQFINTAIGVGLGGFITWLSLKPKQKIDEAAFITKAYHDIYELMEKERSQCRGEVLALQKTIEELKSRITELEKK